MIMPGTKVLVAFFSFSGHFMLLPSTRKSETSFYDLCKRRTELSRVQVQETI